MNPNNLTNEQVQQGFSTIPGAFNPVTGQPNTSNVITPQALQPQAPINLQTPQALQTQPANIEGNMAFFNQLNQQSAESKAIQQKLDAENNNFTNLLSSFGQQGTEQLNLEKQFVNPLQNQIADITGQANVLTAEYNKSYQDYEKLKSDIEAGAGNKGLTTAMVTGQQGAVDRARASELNVKAANIGILQAQALALQGKADLAQKQIDRAIDLKYKGIEQEIKIKQFQLENIKDSLTAEQKKRADSLSYALKKDEERVAGEKEQAKAIEKMIIEATPNAPADIIANAKKISENGGSTLEVAQALGKYGGDYLKTELLKQQIVTEKAQQSNYYANAAKTRTETGLLGQPVGVDGVIATLPKSSQERYYKLQGDFDQATKNYRGAIDSASSITALSKDATPQQQTAIIFQYMKTLDPSSTVREGEFALVGATAGLGDRAVNALKRLDNGSRLNETQINDIVGATKILAENAKKNLEATSNEYDRRAVKFGLPKGLFYEQQDMAQSPADNKFGQAIGIQAPVNYNTTGMSVKPDGSIQFTLPTINKSN